MTVATSIINVNNGNAGWTKANVMDALETAFSQLGLNAGTEQTNVPQGCISPSGNFHLYGAVHQTGTMPMVETKDQIIITVGH